VYAFRHEWEETTYLIPVLEGVKENLVLLNPVVVHGHEERVDTDGESDEEFGEGIKDNECNRLLDKAPWEAPVPNTENVDASETALDDLLLHQVLILLFICVKIVGRDYGVPNSKGKPSRRRGE
jgi:hypothetical protein